MNIAVIGAGLMGHAIAYMLAAAGHAVALQDPSEESLASVPERFAKIAETLGDGNGAVARVTLHSSLAAAVQDTGMVIEAAPEKLALKQALFADLDALTGPEVILASNTSVIPIGQISEKVLHKSRVLGTHFWNPPHIVRLVEVVQTVHTAASNVEQTMAVLAGAGMSPVHVKKDVPGFIGNRLQHALKREAIALVASGVCDAKTLDFVVREGFGARLGVLGPLEQSDMIGMALTLDIHEVLMPHLDTTAEAHPFLRAKVENGDIGMSAGRGFADWTRQEAQEVRDRFARFMAERAAALRSETSRKQGEPDRGARQQGSKP
ncbi:MAG: NAD(P)-binding domain-containing protein [Pararhodobacter sp.]|nr:NAD(P)-binding domain-containing protein [Pararhodobacter sp.]